MHRKSIKTQDSAIVADVKEFPEAIPLKKILGPSFVILALGLGSGEVILWPYLVSNYGLGIAWGAIVGITFQFFINMEIERYALVKGESVFVGIGRLVRWAPYWFIVSTFIGFGLPGIVAASAQVLTALIGVEQYRWAAALLLVVIGVILSSGKTVYDRMEALTKTILLIGVPFIFALAVVLSTPSTWAALVGGVVGRGEGFWFLPPGVALATFMAAFAYSGAGGNLNLTQSIYIKEKGYGMGQYSQKIAGLVRGGQQQSIRLHGHQFEENAISIARFRRWWKVINHEHAIVFLAIGAFSMLLLMVLAYSTAFGATGNAQGIRFVLTEGQIIGNRLSPIVGILFLVAVSVMLFQTQLGVMDSTSRIMAENVAIHALRRKNGTTVHLSKLYSFFVWAQIVFGILLFTFNIYEPKSLIVLGAVLNAIAMTVHIALVSWLNHKALSRAFQPSRVRKTIIAIIFLFFSFFSGFVLWNTL
ncbi:Nramp family divalent metal transporter [Candidatus Uhrbacteria bacterium]|nr:Nramp family divalent metal transporter [Candidatus Uhrbacteria bacterium]